VVIADTTYEDGTGCSETSAHKIQKTGNHPKEGIQRSEHGESFTYIRNINLHYIETEDTVRTSQMTCNK